jgi:hypothetical protein
MVMDNDHDGPSLPYITRVNPNTRRYRNVRQALEKIIFGTTVFDGAGLTERALYHTVSFNVTLIPW